MKKTTVLRDTSLRKYLDNEMQKTMKNSYFLSSTKKSRWNEMKKHFYVEWKRRWERKFIFSVFFLLFLLGLMIKNVYEKFSSCTITMDDLFKQHRMRVMDFLRRLFQFWEKVLGKSEFCRTVFGFLKIFLQKFSSS